MGTVLPVIPGILLIYAGYLLYGFATGWQAYGLAAIVGWSVVTGSRSAPRLLRGSDRRKKVWCVTIRGMGISHWRPDRRAGSGVSRPHPRTLCRCGGGGTAERQILSRGSSFRLGDLHRIYGRQCLQDRYRRGHDRHLYLVGAFLTDCCTGPMSPEVWMERVRRFYRLRIESRNRNGDSLLLRCFFRFDIVFRQDKPRFIAEPMSLEDFIAFFMNRSQISPICSDLLIGSPLTQSISRVSIITGLHHCNNCRAFRKALACPRMV